MYTIAVFTLPGLLAFIGQYLGQSARFECPQLVVVATPIKTLVIRDRECVNI